MGNRGRKSSASLSVVPPADLLDRGRPEPPPDLTHDQKVEWQAIVRRMAPDWFPRETHGLLAEYCRHVSRARKLAKLIEKLERSREVDIHNYDRLARMADRESRIMASLATRMRMTQSASYDRKKGKGTARRRPWEEEE